MTATRRQILEGLGAVSLTALAAGSFTTTAKAQSVDLDKLMEPGPLPELTLGDENAPFKIVEYASMTCPHCASFHATTWPKIKKDYVETGKVYFVFREFPFDPFSAAAFMLARCAPGGKHFEMVDLLFKTQRQWTGAQPLQGLQNVARQAGFTQESFEKCLTNQSLLDGINKVKNRGQREFGVGSTPTFFVNGEKVEGAISFEAFAELLK